MNARMHIGGWSPYLTDEFQIEGLVFLADGFDAPGMDNGVLRVRLFRGHYEIDLDTLGRRLDGLMHADLYDCAGFGHKHLKYVYVSKGGEPPEMEAARAFEWMAGLHLKRIAVCRIQDNISHAGFLSGVGAGLSRCQGGIEDVYVINEADFRVGCPGRWDFEFGPGVEDGGCDFGSFIPDGNGDFMFLYRLSNMPGQVELVKVERMSVDAPVPDAPFDVDEWLRIPEVIEIRGVAFPVTSIRTDAFDRLPITTANGRRIVDRLIDIPRYVAKFDLQAARSLSPTNRFRVSDANPFFDHVNFG